MRLFCFVILCIAYFSCKPKTTSLEAILEDLPSSVQQVVQNKKKHKLQIIYTQIEKDDFGKTHFQTQSYGDLNGAYFYPASSVKMPVAILALQRLNELQKTGYNIDKYTPLKIDSIRAPQSRVEQDTTSEDGLPCIAHYIKKLFIVSDNDAYNRLFEFLGSEYINQQLRAKGIDSTRIVHRLSVSGFDNRYTNPMMFYKGDSIMYRQEEGFTNDFPKLNLKDELQGKAFIDNQGNLNNTAFDFSQKNYLPLEALDGILKRVIFPEAFETNQRFDLTKADHQFLKSCMSMLPKESEYPKYDTSYYDSYAKFLVYGDKQKPMPEHIKIYNKIGMAYGYLTDIAYIVDTENKLGFMLSVSLRVNENETYNDGLYEYDSLGIPFLAELGQSILQYERERKLSRD